MNEQHRAELEAAAKWPERGVWLLLLFVIIASVLGCGGSEEEEADRIDLMPVVCPGEACK